MDQSLFSANMLLAEWHWSLELLYYLVPVLAGVATAGRQAFLPRNDFAMRVVLSLGVFLLGLYLSVHRAARELPLLENIALLFLAAGVVLGLLLGRWCALRLNHIGWSRWFALLLLVPIVNFVGVIALFFIPGRKAAPLEAATTP